MLPPPLREATLREAHERPVIVRYRPTVPVSGVELYGEVENWLTPVPMHEVDRGMREATLHLGPGVYAYKFRPIT